MKHICTNSPALMLTAVLVFAAILSLRAQEAAKVWEEKIVIPNYLVGAPEPNPIFNLGRDSQEPRASSTTLNFRNPAKPGNDSAQKT
jgi:hypothetical protein